MEGVVVAHREANTFSDKVALRAVKILRWGLDRVTGYKHHKAAVHGGRESHMNEEQYMTRNVFLESVAGVPGMVAGMLRHLRSMRRMQRDNGWCASPSVMLYISANRLQD
jgi:ubiquinol oxidase